MANPSTVWTQLALPLSPVGSLPFVGTDGVTIITDVGNYSYSAAGISASGTTSTIAPLQLTVKGSLRVGYLDLSGTIATSYFCPQPSGRVIIPAGAKGIVINCPYAFSNSVILTQLESADTTLINAVVSAHASGVFSITGNANATLNTVVRFVIFNGF